MIYLDSNASTRLDPLVFQAMQPYFGEQYGNPSSIGHLFGLRLQRVIEHVREEIARFFNASATELIFTSGASESINTVIKGVIESEYPAKKRILISQIEHPAVFAVAEYLEMKGISVCRLPVDNEGNLIVSELEKNLTPETALVSLIAANNEIGVLQDIPRITALCRRFSVPLHLDFTQALGHIPLDIRKTPVDFISFGAHKVHGPVGVGGILMNNDTNATGKLVPLIHGGGQEMGLRGGTLNAPLIVGISKALSLLGTSENDTLTKLWRELYNGLRCLPGFELNGPVENRMRSNLNFFFRDKPLSEIAKGLRDVAYSTGSACATGHNTPSRVLMAIGRSREEAASSIRLSLSRFTTTDEIKTVIRQMTKIL